MRQQIGRVRTISVGREPWVFVLMYDDGVRCDKPIATHMGQTIRLGDLVQGGDLTYRVIEQEPGLLLDGREPVYAYETPIPAGYRRLPNGAVVRVADVVLVQRQPGLVFTNVVLRGHGAHSVQAEQAEVEEALWGES